MADDILKTVLLLALPASGKSEVRRYLDHVPPEVGRRDFHFGPTVQLDDFPYVHLMRCIDDACAAQDQPRVFFHAADRPFQNPKDWGTLIRLVAEDYRDLAARRVVDTDSAAKHLFHRIDTAGVEVGLPARLASLPERAREAIAEAVEDEARAQLEEKHAGYPDTLEGKTLVIEFARGGPADSDMPLPDSFGYRYSLAQLPPEILESAGVLYIWVTPEESRRKNDARTNPDDPGSILHHGVPIEVMMNDYGCDDMDWLEANSEKPGTITVRANDATYHLPVGRFDNRVDKTSFLREDASDWPADAVSAVHEGLQRALDRIYGKPAT